MQSSRRRSGLGYQLSGIAKLLPIGALAVALYQLNKPHEEVRTPHVAKLPTTITEQTSDADVLAVMRDYQEKIAGGQPADRKLCTAAANEWRRRAGQESDPELKRRMAILVPEDRLACPQRPVMSGRGSALLHVAVK